MIILLLLSPTWLLVFYISSQDMRVPRKFVYAILLCQFGDIWIHRKAEIELLIVCLFSYADASMYFARLTMELNCGV